MKPTELLSPQDHYDRHRVAVRDLSMAYVDTGAGRPVLFLHGNPTSSYLWRNVIPYLERLGRCVAPDLVGMGASDKLEHGGPDSYRFVEHRSYLDAFLEAVGIGDGVVIVGHDWGGVLGIDWARRHSDVVRGVAAMETILGPLAWADWPEQSRPIFEAMRSPAGEEVVLSKNAFVERILPASVIRELRDEEMEVYREPFRDPGESRRPVLTWARELPSNGEPA
ncbi:MAG: haloalkane dehalogenase, partial [Actinomycetota bacterium]